MRSVVAGDVSVASLAAVATASVDVEGNVAAVEGGCESVGVAESPASLLIKLFITL